MPTPKKKRSIAMVLLAVLILSVVLVQVFLSTSSALETETVLQATVYKTVDTMAYIIRKEVVLPQSPGGFLVPLFSDGDRVATGEYIAAAFSSETSASAYTAYIEANGEAEYYRKLAESSRVQSADPDKISEQAEQAVLSYSAAVQSGDLAQARQIALDMRTKITSAQTANGEATDYNAIAEQYSMLANSYLAAAGAYTPIVTPESGYYISKCDGYENLVDYDAALSMGVDDIDRVTQEQPVETPPNTVGKLISYFDWYLVCNIDITSMGNISVGQKKQIDFPYSGVDSVTAEVVAINDTKDGKTAVVFRAAGIDAEVASLRCEYVSIRLRTISGYRIPSAAVRTSMFAEKLTNAQGQEIDSTTTPEYRKGVYILRNNLFSFKQIDILYEADDYMIVGNTDDDGDYLSGYIKLYDEVVVKGVKVSDAKAIS